MATTAFDREAVDEAVARGSELLKQGKLDEAIQAFRSALVLDEENQRVLALLHKGDLSWNVTHGKL